MSKRFKVIEAYLKKYSEGTLPTTGPIAKYLEIKTGTTKLEYGADAWPDKKSIVYVGIKTFLGGDIIYKEGITQRTSEESSISAVITACNHQPLDNAISPTKGWRAAKAIVKLAATNTTSTPSKITGLSYEKPTSSYSYTIPFGKDADADTYVGVVADIIGALPAAGTNDKWSYRFKTEGFGA